MSHFTIFSLNSLFLTDRVLEGTCHGAGDVRDQDIGTPTYFRYPIEESGGQNKHPGSAHAVLYSLQRTTGRSCDFKTYKDTEVSFIHLKKYGTYTYL